MLLSQLAAAVPGARVLSGGATLIDAVIQDSRQARPGALFVALKGLRVDGHDFAGAAAEKGAAVAGEKVLALPGTVPQLLLPETRWALGELAAELLGRPATSPEVVVRWQSLTASLTGRTAAPAVVVAAVVHGELLGLAPFAAANGVVARAASRLTLVARGLDPRAVSVPEVGHVEQSDEYITAAAGYATGEPEAVAGWIRHCCAAVVRGATEGLAICEAIARG